MKQSAIVCVIGALTHESITVAIPFHRLDKRLLSAVESVVADISATDEILLVDDTREDRDAVNNHFRYLTDSCGVNVRVVQNTSSGVVGARNTALSRASNEVVSFLDSDDLWVSGRRSRHVDILQNFPDVPGVAGQLSYRCPHGVTLGRSFVPSHLSWISRQWRDSPVSLFFPRVRTSAVTLRRKAAEEAGGFRVDEQDAEDFGLWLRMQLTHGLFFLDSEVSAIYFSHALQTSKYLAARSSVLVANLISFNLRQRAISLRNSQDSSRLSNLANSVERRGLLRYAITNELPKLGGALHDLFSREVLGVFFLLVTNRRFGSGKCEYCI